MPPNQKNMNMFNKDMIRTDDLFAPYSHLSALAAVVAVVAT